MIELFLNFTDETGEAQSIPVEQESFVIGRHSENDLSIVNPKLSREHIKIQRFADVFVVSELGSSNGTTINGKDLDEPVGLKDGDILNLGGGLEIEIEIVSDDPNAQNASPENPDDSVSANAASAGVSGAANANSAGAPSQANGGAGLGKALILAPLLGLFLLFSVIGAVLLIGGKPETEVAERGNNDSEFITSSPLTDREDIDKSSDANDNNQTPTPDGTNSNPVPVDTSTPPETETSPTDASSTPEESNEIEKIRAHSFKFMREIARSNQKPILLNNQLTILENKINQVKTSSALAANIKNAQANASAIKQLADSKKLNPTFLATAAIARMGNNGGDVLGKTREMADILDKLQIQIGDEQADDNLIMIAAYDQGVRNDFLQMRNTLQRLADKNPNRASEIRSIWFLKEKGEINDSQFDLALRFLAIGTITQNPEAFNVKAKALNF